MEEIIVREITEQENDNENNQENKNYKNGGNHMDKKLTKSSNRMLCGVCAGLAEYFGIDPTVVRLLWVILTFCGGSGILAYIIAAIIIPEV